MPPELSEPESAIWRKIVDCRPPTWFSPETHPLLVQYCRHVHRATQLSILMQRQEAAGFPDPELYEKLMSREIRQSNIIGILANKMRLSQQATHDAEIRKKTSAAGAPRVWNGPGGGRDLVDRDLLPGA